MIGILSVVSAATERVQAITDLERRIDERTRELTALLDTTTRMASTLELRPLVGMILDQLRGVADYAGAAVLVIEGDDLVTLDARWEGEQDTTLLMQCFPGSRNDRPWAEALPREPIIIPDLREDTVFSRWYWQAVGEVMNRPPYDQFRAWLGVPLLLKSVPIGILVMAATKPNFYTPEHARLALAFANQAAIAVENARLYEQAPEAGGAGGAGAAGARTARFRDADDLQPVADR
ncbi:MAG: GAF domain-containing protein [Dehalococcoidia bacterium]